MQYFSEKQGGVCVRAGVNKQVERWKHLKIAFVFINCRNLSSFWSLKTKIAKYLQLTLFNIILQYKPVYRLDHAQLYQVKEKHTENSSSIFVLKSYTVNIYCIQRD